MCRDASKMSEAGPNTEDVLRRLSEVLDVLKRITEDLQDISRSLKASTPQGMPSVAPSTGPSATVGKTIEEVRTLFAKELEAMLIFEDKGSFIQITPRQFLGSENFAKIASAVRDAGGEYISAGRDSHFRIPK